MGVPLSTRCQYQYKVESVQLFSPFAIHGVLVCTPKDKKRLLPKHTNCFPLTVLVARYMILAGATALNPRMADLIYWLLRIGLSE